MASPDRRLKAVTMSQAEAYSVSFPAAAQTPYASRNVARLAIAQALAGANSTVLYATGAVVGSVLAPHQALPTLPVPIFLVSMSPSTLPAAPLPPRHRRPPPPPLPPAPALML